MRRHVGFAVLVLLGAAIYSPSVHSLVMLAFRNETYSHVLIIPAVSLFLLWIERQKVFSKTGTELFPGAAVCVGGLVVYALAFAIRDRLDSPAFRNQDISNDFLTLCMLGAVAWVIGSFLVAYGRQAFKRARFALLFLVFAVPLPMFLLNAVIAALQFASAEASDVVFKLTSVAYHRHGLVFEFPNVSVQVAEQCSGIRSSLSLFILSIITGHLFLGTFSRRLILALAIFPIAMVKNAFRIVTITLLANYVDMRFLTNHWIHSSGGILFFAVALVLFIPLVWALRRTEARLGRRTE